MVSAVFLVLRPILTAAGTPELLHDWAWPVDASGVRAMASDLSAVLLAANWDAPAWLPRVHPVQAFVLGASFIAPSPAVLKIVLFTVLAAGGCGAYRLARVLGAGDIAAAIGGVWYVAAPFTGDKLAAGHLWILVAYAAYPFAVEAVLSRRSIGAQFFWFACTSTDIHYVGFDVLTLGLLAVMRQRSLREARGAWLGLTAFLPSIVAAPLAGAAGAFAGQQANPFYNQVNSTPFLDAIRGVGYFAHYDAYGRTLPVDIALWVPVACAIVLAVRRRPLPLALLLTGGILAAGTLGPAAPLIAWAFRAIPAVAVYREFFDFTVFVSLGGALALACLPKNAAALGVAGIVAIAAVFPQLTGAYAMQMHSYVPARSAAAVVEQIETAPGDAMVLARPAQPPLTFDAFPGGVDFLGNRVGTHGTIDATHEMPPIARAALTQNPQRQPALFSEMRAAFDITRGGWASLAAASLEPGFREHAPRPHVAPVEIWQVARRQVRPFLSLRGASVCSASDFSAIDGTQALVFAGDAPACPAAGWDMQPARTPYPRDGWVPYDSLWFLAPWAAQSVPGSLFTTRSGIAAPAPLHCKPGAAYVYRGYALNAGKSVPFRRSVTGCKGFTTSGATVLEPVQSARASREITADGADTVAVLRSAPWFVEFRGNVRGEALLEMKTQFSPFWRIYRTSSGLTVGSHLKTEGTFNAWDIAGNGQFHAVALYWPALAVLPLEILLAAGYLWAIAAWIRERIRRAAPVRARQSIS